MIGSPTRWNGRRLVSNPEERLLQLTLTELLGMEIKTVSSADPKLFGKINTSFEIKKSHCHKDIADTEQEIHI